MPNYYLNQNPQSTGEHEVHKQGCSWFPSSVLSLGSFSDAVPAVRHAKSLGYNADGCYYCCREAHTR